MRRPKSLLRTLVEPIAIAIVLAAAARLLLHVYSIPSASMAPTLNSGDHIVVTRYIGSAPERGDVVVFDAGGGELMVKRIVAVPGDLVDSRMGRLRVGGYTVAEPYVREATATGSIPPTVVPQDSYFVLGDNRRDSIDSRARGPVHRSAIVGRARVILWTASAAGPAPARAASPGPHDGSGAAAQPSSRLFKWVE